MNPRRRRFQRGRRQVAVAKERRYQGLWRDGSPFARATFDSWTAHQLSEEGSFLWFSRLGWVGDRDAFARLVDRVTAMLKLLYKPEAIQRIAYADNPFYALVAKAPAVSWPFPEKSA